MNTRSDSSKLDRILEKQMHLEVAIEQLRGSIKPRQEIDFELDQRLSITAYRSDRDNDEKRFKRLEDAPTASWAKAGILISGGIGCAGVTIAMLGILVTILIASHVI